MSRQLPARALFASLPRRAGSRFLWRLRASIPGLTQQFTAPLRRVINKDGKFNVRRRGTTWRDFHPYLHLINMGWPAFPGDVCFWATWWSIPSFATVYFALGPGQLQGADAPTRAGAFLNAFFFSAHTLSTVGYGNISPKGTAANVVAAVRSADRRAGVRRGHRPAVRPGIAALGADRLQREHAGDPLPGRPQPAIPRGQPARQFADGAGSARDADDRGIGASGQPTRNYKLLRLERETVLFLPLTWTVVHPIDRGQPALGQDSGRPARLQAEVLILIKAYDDTFSQTVLARYSYRHDEILWDKRFAPAFFVDEEGDLVLEMPKVGAVTPEGEPQAAG